MHGTGGQRIQRLEFYVGKVGTIAQAIDGATHLLRGARLLFIQCHSSVNGRNG
jgi:hypothetical protein